MRSGSAGCGPPPATPAVRAACALRSGPVRIRSVDLTTAIACKQGRCDGVDREASRVMSRAFAFATSSWRAAPGHETWRSMSRCLPPVQGGAEPVRAHGSRSVSSREGPCPCRPELDPADLPRDIVVFSVRNVSVSSGRPVSVRPRGPLSLPGASVRAGYARASAPARGTPRRRRARTARDSTAPHRDAETRVRPHPAGTATAGRDHRGGRHLRRPDHAASLRTGTRPCGCVR